MKGRWSKLLTPIVPLFTLPLGVLSMPNQVVSILFYPQAESIAAKNEVKNEVSASGAGVLFHRESYDVCVAGAGLSGAVIAEQIMLHSLAKLPL